MGKSAVAMRLALGMRTRGMGEEREEGEVAPLSLSHDKMVVGSRGKVVVLRLWLDALAGEDLGTSEDSSAKPPTIVPLQQQQQPHPVTCAIGHYDTRNLHLVP
jgi:hypothetical protein